MDGGLYPVYVIAHQMKLHKCNNNNNYDHMHYIYVNVFNNQVVLFII